MTLDLTHWMLLSALIFSVGLIGLLTRKNAVALLLSVEVMANAVNLNLVAIGQHRGDETGQVMALFGIALTVAEVVVGLAIIILIHRLHKTIELDEISELSG
jgi:NADH:ubiquinone oxidoreductase subunit K